MSMERGPRNKEREVPGDQLGALRKQLEDAQYALKRFEGGVSRAESNLEARTDISEETKAEGLAFPNATAFERMRLMEKIEGLTAEIEFLEKENEAEFKKAA